TSCHGRYPSLFLVSQMFSLRPVSSSDLRLERTFGQPPATLAAIAGSCSSRSCVTVRQTRPVLYSAMSKVTREGSFEWSGRDHVITSRCGGSDSRTVPSIITVPESSPFRCSQREPFFQSETL